MKKTSIILGVCTLVLLTACKKDLKPPSGVEEMASATRSDNPVAQAASDPYVSNEILVKFVKGTSETGIATALARIGGNVQEKVLTKAMQRVGDEGFYVVHTPLAVLEAVGKMKGLEGVEYAEPNFIYQHHATSNDTYYTNGSLWGMYGDATYPANQYGSQAGEAWAAGKTGSAGVYVGVIDEGIQFNHTDLDAQIWTNPYDAADGLDNDGNGYVDDIHGWDFANNDNSIYDGGTSGSSDNHGTHVSGTIGAESNGAGVVGINWNVTIISAKFLGSNGGSLSNAVKAVDYITDLKLRDVLDIVATNNSWGGGGFSQSLLDAITRAAKQNILFIAAAGNGNMAGIGQNNDKRAHYPSNYNTQGQTGGPLSSLNNGSPCNYDAVIAVAAIRSNGTLAGFSNYGATTVDLGAPGSGIWSTTANNGGYSSYSGTSMATPHVTGAAALHAAYSSDRGASLKTAILNTATATPTSSLAGKTVTGGRLNVSGF